MKIYLTPMSPPEPYKWERELKNPQVDAARMAAYRSGKPEDIAKYSLSKRLTRQYGQVPKGFIQGGSE